MHTVFASRLIGAPLLLAGWHSRPVLESITHHDAASPIGAFTTFVKNFLLRSTSTLQPDSGRLSYCQHRSGDSFAIHDLNGGCSTAMGTRLIDAAVYGTHCVQIIQNFLKSESIF